jgi:tetratricopeptide (TPR) repeat protein
LSAIINVTLGDVRGAVGRFDDALVAYRQAIEVEPAMAVAYAYIGDVHAYGLGRLDTAMAWYEKAASLDPDSPAILAGPARAQWELGDYTEAGRWLIRMLDTGEGTLYSHWVAALLYVARDDGTSARRHAQRAAELNPANPGVLSLLRDDDLRRGDYAAARARYAKAFPGLFAKELRKLRGRDAFAAIDLALVLQHTGEGERALALLERAEAYVRTIPRMGRLGYGISDVAIHALRGNKVSALAKLREAEQAGWRRLWRYYREFDPNLASLRNEPEFKAVFADIERDMAQQRARLAARPKDAPLELTEATR